MIHTLDAERFLVYGLEAGGKSQLWIELLLKLPDQPKFYVIDTDGSAKYSLEGLAHGIGMSPEDVAEVMKRVRIWKCDDPYGALEDPNGKITYHEFQWTAIMEAVSQMRRMRPSPESWIVVDRIDTCFDAVQSYWITKAYGEDFSVYWAELKAEQEEAKKGTDRDYGGFMGARDWVPIKKLYATGIKGILSTPRVHKIGVALAKPPFAQSKKAAEQIKQYGELMPAGEGNQGADFWTTIQVGKKADGKHQVWVRRTKRAGGIGEVVNGKPKPVVITAEDGSPDFYDAWWLPVFIGEE